MGRKSKILYYTVLLVNVLCFILDLLPIPFPFFRISFAMSLTLIGLLLIARAITLKIDSSMFFGVAIFCCGVLNFVLYFGQVYANLTTYLLWPYYLLAVALAGLCTYLYFKDKLQLRLFILFSGFGGVSVLFSLAVLNLWWFIALMIVWFVVYFAINIIAFKRRN